MPIIVGAKCIVVHPTKILGGRPTLQRLHGVYMDRCKLPQRGPGRSRGSVEEPRTQWHFAVAHNCMLTKRIWLQHFRFFGQHCNQRLIFRAYKHGRAWKSEIRA